MLDRYGIDYMITGSVASSLQGDPRSSHDIDLVIAIRDSDIPILTEVFASPDYYLEEGAVREANIPYSFESVRFVPERIRVAIVRDSREGDKVYFWILTKEPFDQSRFARKREQEVFGIRVKVSTAEDTILAKLLWADKSGGSQKQFTDALRVFEVQYKNLDLSYLDRWAGDLGLSSLWLRLKTEAEIVD